MTTPESKPSAPAPKTPEPIPLVDLNAQRRAMGGELEAAIAAVVECAAYIGGPFVERFERDYAAWCGAKHAVGCSSGTSALQLILEGLGIGPGDEVICPTMTFIATAESILHAGATPVFADIDPATRCLLPEAAEAAVTQRTKAIVGVDLYGRLADWAGLADVAERHGLALIEDAAQSHGARASTHGQGGAGGTFEGKRAGAIGLAAAFSFYPGKNLGACGDAGAIATNDAALADAAKRLADHGRRDKYEHGRIGHNHRLDALQASVLTAKLRWIDRWNERRHALAGSYVEALQGVGDLVLPSLDAGAGHVWHLCVVETDRRDALLDHLKKEGIGAGIHYPIPVHLQPAMEDHPQARAGAFPASEALARRCLSLPLFPEMTADQIGRVVGSISRFFG